MTNLLNLVSPAKINLFLHIVGRRPDGYHNLQTFFQFLDLFDELEFEFRKDSHITLSMPGYNLPHDSNLITKAAHLLQKETITSFGANIICRKKIPMGAGFGGGSSNAATTLLALNYLWQTNLNLQELAEIGLQLGADVPVFVLGKSAWAEGVGERLQPISVDEPWYVLLIPPCEISTAKIFSDPELTRNTSKITIHEFLAHGGQNDCEMIVRKNYPIVGQAIDWLSQFAPAKLTGTGSGVFATFESEDKAKEVASNIKPPLRSIVAKGLNESPLHKNIAKIC